MDTAAVLDAAERLASARLEGRAVEPLPEGCRPIDEAEAYVIQAAVHQRLIDAGFGSLAGWKLGGTNATAQAAFGIDGPVFGGVFSRGVHEGRGAFDVADFHAHGVECEVVVRFGRDVPPEAAPYDRGSIADYIDACRVGIEVVDNRYGDWKAAGVHTVIADDFFNRGCVLGEAVSDWNGLDLAEARGTMGAGGETFGTGVGSAALGHPLEAAAWLANALARQGRGPAAGQFVFTGAMFPLTWLEGPASVVAGIDGLGEATAVFR